LFEPVENVLIRGATADYVIFRVESGKIAEHRERAVADPAARPMEKC
jgi:hypothetical protein